jgi:CPA1 family monovalent cation:H+ antiporter
LEPEQDQRSAEDAVHDIVVVLGLLVCVMALVPLANRLAMPYPIPLVVGGLVLGFIPNTILPDIVLEPDLVFLLFLPPLLYWAALTTPWRDFLAHLLPILLLAVGLVVATTFGVAAVAVIALPALTWQIAVVLGAIVSPPDAVAATAIADRLGLPRRVATILEGESLVNDATALVVYGTAVAIVGRGAFSWVHTGLEFCWEVVGGVGIGVLVGWLIAQVRRHMEDPVLESMVSLLSPFAAYLPANAVGSSGVLATVATGFIVQRYSPLVSGSRSRLQAESVWEVVNLLLNGLIFILIGLQLHPIFLALVGKSLLHLVLQGAVVSLAAISLRIAWILLGSYLVRKFTRRPDEDTLSRPEATVIAWAGMRGVVSLAAAQALPVSFPQRNLILFLTFSVILSTLVFQGLTLPALIRRLGLAEGDAELLEEMRARIAATQAALAELDDLAETYDAPANEIEDIREHYAARVRALSARLHDVDWTDHRERLVAHRDLRQELLDRERQTLVLLRDRGEINDHALRRIQRDLDLEELRLGGHP